MAKYHEIRICILTNAFVAGYSLEKKYTDINLPYLWSNEYKNIIGSLIFDLRKR